MIRVLVLITTEFISVGGLTTVMMNYYRALEKSDMIIDFASTNAPEDSLLSELHMNHSQYFELGSRKNSTIKYMGKLGRLLSTNHYDIVHINGNSATMIIESFVARVSGVKRIICHNHAAQHGHPVFNFLFNPLFRHTYTDAIAVSDDSGKWLFKDRYKVLNNAIDLTKYRFDPVVRERFRQDFGIGDKIVIGTVGKLNTQKNQSFLLDVFSDYHKRNSESILMIVGGGPLENELKSKAIKLDLSDDVYFLGMRNDAQQVIQCFDVFLFTSIHEGLGLAVIEAQASGLKCIVSDAVPPETRVTGNISYVDLREQLSVWSDKISLAVETSCDRQIMSNEACSSISLHGYDISLEAKNLELIYRGEN